MITFNCFIATAKGEIYLNFDMVYKHNRRTLRCYLLNETLSTKNILSAKYTLRKRSNLTNGGIGLFRLPGLRGV